MYLRVKLVQLAKHVYNHITKVSEQAAMQILYYTKIYQYCNMPHFDIEIAICILVKKFKQ